MAESHREKTAKSVCPLEIIVCKRLDDRSRMKGDFHVRFCESLRGEIPRATRLVILARYQSDRIRDWVEATVEEWMGLEINREKTKVVRLKEDGAVLDYLSYSFSYLPDRFGRKRRYLSYYPSVQSCAEEREVIREILSPRHCFVPVPDLIKPLNRQLAGWGMYFS